MLLDQFKLQNIGKDYADFQKAMGQEKNIAAFYATQNLRYLIASQSERFFVYITQDRISAKEAHKILSEYTNGEVVYLTEKDEVLLNLQFDTSSSLASRISTLSKIALGQAKGVVVSAESLMQYVPDLGAFLDATLKIEIGKTLDIYDAIDSLVFAGYSRVDAVSHKGEFSQRGDILDIWSNDMDFPVRIDFFGDSVEQMKVFAPDTMLATSKINSIVIPPHSDILISEEKSEILIERLLKLKLSNDLKLSEIISNNISKIEINPSDPSLLWIVPYIKEAFSDIFSYIPKDSVIFIDEPSKIDDKLKLYKSAHNVRVASFTKSSEATKSHEDIVFDKEHIYKSMEDFTKVCFQQSTGYNPIFYPGYIQNFKSNQIPNYVTNHQALIADLKSYLVFGSKVYIFANDDDGARTLKSYLEEHHIYTSLILHDEYIKYINIAKTGITKDISGEINIIGYPISKGFNIPKYKLVLIGHDDISRKVKVHSKSRRKKRSSYVLPSKGDYVVHDRHGIGISGGIQTVDTFKGKKDFYIIEYAKKDRLYVPIDHINEIEKYTGGGTPTLHRLGSKQFENIKERVRKSVKKLAIDLVSVYKQRAVKKGFKYSKDTVWQQELETSFPYEETEDQLMAIVDIKKDMEEGKIMDRLLCGDVGFGKTEVAIRTIFKTILDGKQAAFLCPTTILCQQHYDTIMKRFEGFDINIAKLSRFESPKQIKSSLKDIASGKVNVVVATHRMLSSDVTFNDLGLLVLDEEQKFGVEHKEKIKLLKNNINVLSLSATPIPRTLHMALSGIRDVSLLETPPINRLPIETYVVEQTDSLLVDACTREIARGGQVFILYNRVKTIEKFYNHLVSLLGDEVKVIYAHGQMPTTELENKIADFYNQKVQVLIATTIIENGIDIPSANTLIVIDSDRLGLSELYQIRGRVGRSDVLAYAYFTIPQGKVLTEDATKRLDAILRHTELGSGMKIAMRDLEIRGAGNILGREQHGNMGKVGYEMYMRLLNETIDELEGRTVIRLRDIEINFDGDISLDKEYIKNQESRVLTYRQIADLFSESDLLSLENNIEDAYGPIPKQTKRLMLVGLIKNLAQKIGVKQIQQEKNSVTLTFYDKEMFKIESIFNAISFYKDYVSLIPVEEPIIKITKQGSTDTKMLFTKDFLIKATEGL
ncbi:MAG TPA: transcription-repair coupling factor [Clostridiales bacterium]|nr:transcription-repair coupling factor [Clostridiales bacterium]